MERARCKDLLRLEKPYMQAANEQKVESVLKMMQPEVAKPNFGAFPKSALFSQLESFLPVFKQDTQQLLANPELIKEKQMDNILMDARAVRKSRYQKKKMQQRKVNKTGQKEQKPYIAMDLMGVFDMKEEQKEEQKVEQRVMVQEMQEEGSSTE